MEEMNRSPTEQPQHDITIEDLKNVLTCVQTEQSLYNRVRILKDMPGILGKLNEIKQILVLNRLGAEKAAIAEFTALINSPRNKQIFDDFLRETSYVMMRGTECLRKKIALYA